MDDTSGRATYAGIEEVDQRALAAQYALAEALWSKLVEQGSREGVPGRIEAYFRVDHELVSASLARAFGAPGWDHEFTPADDGSGRFAVKVITPTVALTRNCLLELVDVAMVEAHKHGCAFDGFQVDVSATRRRGWWRLW